MKRFHVIGVTILIYMIMFERLGSISSSLAPIIYLNCFMLGIYVAGWFSVNTLIYIIVDITVFFFFD